MSLILDRITPPKYKAVSKIDIPPISKEKTINGVPVFFVSGGTQDVVQVEFIFKAGTSTGAYPLISSLANSLIFEGTEKQSSFQIAEHFDFYGAYVQNECDKDRATLSLFTINKYFKETFPYFMEVIQNASFPEDEVKVKIANSKQHFIIDMEKNSSICRKLFTEKVFGKDSSYGKTTDEKDYDIITRNELLDYYKNYYQNGEVFVVVSGRVTDEMKRDILAISIPNKSIKSEDHASFKNNSERAYFEKEKSVQSAIRIGKTTINKLHKDFTSFSVLNTILGGYFGSRLMANIREDKGYTYGIGSGLISLEGTGYFYIATEVGVDVTQNTLDEVYKEIGLLQQNEVSKDELDLVKNYMLGNLQGDLDGPFAWAEFLRNQYVFGLEVEQIKESILGVQNVTPAIIKEMAVKYLQADSLTEVIVGKKQ